MKILAVLFLHPRVMGGYEIFLSELAESLNRAGHSLTLIFPSPPCPAFAEALRKNRAGWLTVPAWADAQNRLKQNSRALFAFLLRLFRRERFDLVDFHFCAEIPVSLLGIGAAISRRKMRFIWHQHSEIALPDNFFKRFFSRIKFVSLFADEFVVPSRKLREAIACRGVRKNRVRIIPNGIPDPGNRIRPAGQTKTVRLLTVANLRPVKGVKYLLAAFETALRQNSGLELAIAGDGPEGEDLKKLAGELRLAGKVTFLGLQKNVPDLLKNADIFILPSLQESFGISALEAMACSLPVIASNVGGLPEIVRDGRNGFLVPARDPDSLSAAILKLAANPDLREQMGREGRQIYLSGFTLGKMVREHLNLYQNHA